VILLGVAGMRDAASAGAVADVLRSCDANVQIHADLKAGIVEVESGVGAEALCAALQEAGYIAAPLARRPGIIGMRDLLGLSGRALLWGLGGGVAGSVLGLGIMLVVIAVLPECRSGGDEGACAMGVPVGMAGVAAIGGAVAVGITLMRGGGRLYRRWKAG
jgi:hypothetical protein